MFNEVWFLKSGTIHNERFLKLFISSEKLEDSKSLSCFMTRSTAALIK